MICRRKEISFGSAWKRQLKFSVWTMNFKGEEGKLKTADGLIQISWVLFVLNLK